MKNRHQFDVSDAEVFAGDHLISLAEVQRRAEAALEGSALRDLRSAFACLRRNADVDLETVLAQASEVRRLLDGLTPGAIGVSRKRLDNIRSLVIAAVKRHGMRRTWITRQISLDAEWIALMEQVPRREHRWALSRLACYCTVKAVSPEDVTTETLRGLHAALEAEAISKNPRNLLKRTIAVWNICSHRVAGWPSVVLNSPFKTESYMLPLDAFPDSFRQEIDAWEARMLTPDPFDLQAPVRALRPATIASYRLTFRRAASALVRSDALRIDEVTGLAVLFEGDNLKIGLRPYLPKDGSGATTGHAHKMAIQFAAIARNHLQLDAETLAAIGDLIKRLDPRDAGRMGKRNRTRLAQFDDPDVVQRFLAFPEQERDRALVHANPLRRAKGIERALAISILIFTGVRMQNLRTIRLDRNIVRVPGRVLLRFAASETKTHAELDLELPAETIELLDLFLEQYRAAIPGAEGSPFLFPSPSGGPRSYSAMRDAVSKPLRKHAGITLSPHLYRHVVAKIVAERDPSLLTDVSRRLGHKSTNATKQFYLGTETPAASRRINRLLQAARADPDLQP